MISRDVNFFYGIATLIHERRLLSHAIHVLSLRVLIQRHHPSVPHLLCLTMIREILTSVENALELAVRTSMTAMSLTVALMRPSKTK